MSSAAVARVWSPHQSAIFADVDSGRGHTVVVARAGSGKTSTIIEAVGRVPREERTMIVAFNKTIEQELRLRVPHGIEVRTLHGYGYSLLRRALGSVSVDADKVRKIVRGFGVEVTPSEWRALRAAVSLAKSTLAKTSDDVHRIIADFDIDVVEENEDAFAELVLQVLTACAENRQIVDFDDMPWLPIRLGLRHRGYDRVVVDECQDLNRCQLALAWTASRSDGRILAVGDDRQAIYAWRGADPQAMPRMVERLSAKTLPLSVSYRCARAVIAEAQRYVPDIEAAPGAPRGLVQETSSYVLQERAEPGDLVLSRYNAPLVALCLRWLAEDRPATIIGRDLGAGLSALVARSGATSIDGLLAWLTEWEAKETRKAKEKDRDTNASNDRAACLRGIARGAQSVEQVLHRIERLFSDEGGRGRILLSSTHRAKGLEADRVWMLVNTFRSFKHPGSSVEEDNLAYVAITRAKQELRFVHGEDAEAAE